MYNNFDFAKNTSKNYKNGGNMLKAKLKKYILCSFFCIIFLTLLYISTNYNLSIIKIFKSIQNKIIAATAQSSTSTTNASNADMVALLARLINGEARGEPYEGQVAVGAVVLNRVKSAEFPNTISGVIYQKGQFSCVTDGQFNKKIDENSTVYKAAEEAINGSDPSNGALFFYNPKTTKSKWLFSLKTVKTIGRHVFATSNK